MGADENWRGRAMCHDLDPEEYDPIFFPHPNSDGAEAKEICWHCPVAAECLTFALDTGQEFGVWGAMTERERFVLRTGKQPATHHPKRCGTYSGVGRHRKAGEVLCAACMDALNVYERNRRAERAS